MVYSIANSQEFAATKQLPQVKDGQKFSSNVLFIQWIVESIQRPENELTKTSSFRTILRYLKSSCVEETISGNAFQFSNFSNSYVKNSVCQKNMAYFIVKVLIDCIRLVTHGIFVVFGIFSKIQVTQEANFPPVTFAFSSFSAVRVWIKDCII